MHKTTNPKPTSLQADLHLRCASASMYRYSPKRSPPQQFSATCWHFAEHLTDVMEANGEPIVPFGLISSQWGGTEIEHWQPNTTLNAGVCKNNSGGAYAPWQNSRYGSSHPLRSCSPWPRRLCLSLRF